MKIQVMNLLKPFAFFMALLIVGTSCEKEGLTDSPNPEMEQPSDNEVNDEQINNVLTRNQLGGFNAILGFEDCDCYGPLDSIDWDGLSEEELYEAVEDALAQLSEEELEALFTPVCVETGEVYPNACFAECEGVTEYSICDFDDWGCDGEDFDFVDCYEIVFPVNVIFSDGTTVTVSDYDSYFELLIFSEEVPQFVFPFDVQDDEGNITTVNTEEEWAELGFDCFGVDVDWDFGEGMDWDTTHFETICLELVYPVSWILNGESITINSQEEEFEFFENTFLNWDGTSELNLELGYPLNLILIETGETFSVENDEEYFDLYLEKCNG